MYKRKYSGVNDRRPYPVEKRAFKDGDSVSYLNVEDGELKLNGETVGNGSGGGGVTSWNDLEDKPFFDVVIVQNLMTGENTSDKTFEEISTSVLEGKMVRATIKGIIPDYNTGEEMEFVEGYSSRALFVNGVVYFFVDAIEDNKVIDGKPSLNSFCIKISEDEIERTGPDTVFSSLYVMNSGGFFLRSNSKKLFRVTVDDNGDLTTELIE